MILDSDWLLEAERGLILDITIAPSAEVPKVSKPLKTCFMMV